MKKILALLLAALMVGSMMTGCTKQEATSGEESAQTQQTESEAKEEPVEEETQAAFTGAYIADPEYIKSKIGSEDVIFIDARGACLLYTSASCAGNFSRAGCQEVRHLLVKLLQTEEQPPKGVKSLFNRAKYKLL